MKTTLDAESLELAERDYRQAVQRAEELRLVRNELVRQAIAQGYSYGRIARATGISRARIGQLALAG